MSWKSAVALAIVPVLTAAAPATRPNCPKWEAGTRYPWQSNEIMRGDEFAWVILQADRSGYPVRCEIGNNNYPDNQGRLYLCKQYYELWRGPRATASEPRIRTFKRFSLISGYRHQKADAKARKNWFIQHPDERRRCYPEPSRPDRMDL
jgi:hypothetical protein